MITRQQIRAVLEDGGQMVDSAGRRVGRILTVVLAARTSQPAWVTVDCHLCTGNEVVVPLGRADLRDGSIQIPYTAADICAAPRPDGAAGLLDRQQAEELRLYYDALDSRVQPAIATNGHRRTNGAPSGSHLMIAAADVLPVVPGLDVRTGNGIPAAYPATDSGPWPPVSTSSSGPPWWERRQWRWPSLPTSVRDMRLELRSLLDLTGLPDDEVEDLVLAAGEAAANAVEHADSPSVPFFDVLTEVGQDRARIVIQDHGRWRAPTAAGSRGRGLQMIGGLVDATLTVGSRGTTVVLDNRRGSSH